MGETDGSSSAAQSAHSTTETSQDDTGGGLITRLFSRKSSDKDPQDAAHAGAPNAAPTAVPARGMMNLRRQRVDDVAIPSADILAVPVTTSREELVQVFRESGMSRVPVYDGTLDTPLGFVHLKDFALMYGFNGHHDGFDLVALLRPLLFVPPSMPLPVLMAKMQTERRHMALVIDEYGGVDGLLTIEDLIEQVVGEIEDEHDSDEAATWTKEKTGCYLALAKTPLDEFEAEIGRSLTSHDDVDEEEIDTLGGLVFMLSGRVPARGEVVLHPDGPEFEVVDADPRRIKRLRVRLQDQQA